MVHIHGDVEGLKYFSDKNGVCAYSIRAVAYAMQDADIVAVFYNYQQAEDFYKYYPWRGRILPPIYWWDENRWNNRKVFIKSTI